MASDSVAVFGEGPFEDQLRELVEYTARSLPEEERQAFIRPFQDVLKTAEGSKPLSEDDERRAKLLGMLLKEIKGLGEGTDKEIEGFFNLVNCHLFTLYPPESTQLKDAVLELLKVISSSPASQTSIKYTVLSNLFNATATTSTLRLPIYKTLVEIALANDGIDVLQLSKKDVYKWLSEWDISEEEKSAFLKTIADAYATSEQLDISYDYTLGYVRSLPSGSDKAHNAAVDLVTMALRLPSVFDFDPLFKLNAVVALKDHEIFQLLQIFLNDGLPEYNQWAESHSGAFDKYNLDRSQLERKIRLLTLATLGFKNIGQSLSYSTIAEAIQINPSEVERWVIDIIRSGLLSGKLSQTTQTVYITRSRARTFEHEQWETLDKRISAWKSGLAGVLEVVANAKKQGGLIPPPPQAQAQNVTPATVAPTAA